MFNQIINNLYLRAYDLNTKNIINLFEINKNVNFLDVGCDDGKLTEKITKHFGLKNAYGVEIVDESVILARKRGIKVKKFDLNHKFDFPDNYFNVILANQIIEHLQNVDNFISELYRVLKPNGYAIISTENQSSWCNIFASIMGWQIFSLTNISVKKAGIGNPLALYRGVVIDPKIKSFCHVRIYSILALKDLFEMYGLRVEEVKGAGYFPFPALLGRIDVWHSHFITLKVRKNRV